MEWEAPAPEERTYQQVLLQTVMRWGLYMAPVSVAMYVRAYLRQPTWATRTIAAAAALGALVCLWGLPRVRRGELRLPTRLLLASFLLIGPLTLLVREERVRAFAALGFPCIILLALALESPAAGIAWASAAVAGFVMAYLRWSPVHVPKLITPPELAVYLDLAVPLYFLLIVLLGRSTTRHLHQSLALSEEAQADLQRSNTRLVQQEAELRRAQVHLSDLASELDKRHQELQGFVRVVSKDLLEPLQELRADSQQLRERSAGPLDELGRHHVQGIAESTQHMNALVTGLLAYSNVQLPPAEREEVALGPLLERVVSALDLRRRAEVKLPADAPTVRAHPLRLEQVFSNLLENAIKFQRPGIRPEVAVEWADRGEAWELTVRDNGIGIQPQHFEKIFGIFQRLHLQTEYEGTGIGLAVVRKAIEEHGGKVWVESTPGQGSAFHFTLPRPAGERVPDAPEEREDEPARRRTLEEQELTPEGKRLQRRLMAVALGSLLAVWPLSMFVFLRAFVREPSWSRAFAPLGLLLMGALIGWCLWRVRQGKVRRIGRVLLAVLLLAAAVHMARGEDQALLSGSMLMALILLFATSLERPSIVLRWLGVAVALYAVALALRHNLPLPPSDLGPFGQELLRFSPVMGLLLFTLFAWAGIRDLRRAAARSRTARAELERVHASLKARTAGLRKARADLSALTERLTRGNRELRSFAYVASHDLRAPLRALANYSRFLREDCSGQLDEAGRAHLERIERNARHMDALVAGLLEYSRIGRVQLTHEWVSLGEILERAIRSLKLREQADVTLPADLPAIWGARPRLEQIFLHLLGNAVKFRREGVRLRVEIECMARGDAWELAVRDNGIGIAPEDVERIFGLFQRVHPRERYEGTGVGLPIVKRVVEEHGGRLRVESTPGEGSVFRFTVPRPLGA